jgi:flagellar biosynthesis chaperone FliJ
MKRFKFALRPVAIIREHHQMKAQQALALSAAAVARSEAQLALAQARTAELEQMIAAGRSGPFRPDLQVSFLQAYGRERTAESAAGKALDAVRIEMAQRRMAAIEAQRKVKVVSQLEAKARATHRAETFRAEQTEIDDRAASAAFHRSPSP